jgi:hypothetical protein
MSTPTLSFFEDLHPNRRKLLFVLAAVTLATTPLLIWPGLARRLLATDFLPHL